MCPIGIAALENLIKTWFVYSLSHGHAGCDVRCQMRPYHMLYESVRSVVRGCAPGMLSLA